MHSRFSEKAFNRLSVALIVLLLLLPRAFCVAVSFSYGCSSDAAVKFVHNENSHETSLDIEQYRRYHSLLLREVAN